MDEKVNGFERRSKPRIERNLIIRFKPHYPQDEQSWQVTQIQNISLTGCFIYSQIPYKVGDILDIQIDLPGLDEPMKFLGEVKRSLYKEGETEKDLYSIGIQFLEMEESKREIFVQEVDFFVKQDSKTKPLASVNRRLSPRISWNFFVRFKSRNEPDTEGWHITTVRNISSGGCFFYSQIPYQLGEILDIKIDIPGLIEPIKFVGEVRRCTGKEEQKTATYGIGIRFTEIEENKRDIFLQKLEFFLKKESEK